MGQFRFLKKENFQHLNSQTAKLSNHSPNFKSYIEDIGYKEYRIITFDSLFKNEIYIPSNLNQFTIDSPNFLTNNQLLFLSEDKIIKSYNFIDKKEEFIVSHCQFPGAEDEIKLATLLKVGN